MNTQTSQQSQSGTHCAFCGAVLVVRETADQIDMQESGGMWRRHEFACQECDAVVERNLVLKIGTTRETWCIARMPTAAIKFAAELRCPSCQEPIVSCWPSEVAPEPASAFGTEMPAVTTRSIEYVCSGCHCRYVLQEDIRSQWQLAKDHSVIAPPVTYRR
jgi:hypothetical protein